MISAWSLSAPLVSHASLLVHNYSNSDGILYDISKYANQISRVQTVQLVANLLDGSHPWKPFNNVHVYNNPNKTLDITFKTNRQDQIYGRAFLNTKIQEINTPITLSVDFASKSNMGKALFMVEARNNFSGINFPVMHDNYAWSKNLGNTNGTLVTKTFTIPAGTLEKDVEFRFYIISFGPGDHALSIKKAILTTAKI
jgi:hypothetical protein